MSKNSHGNKVSTHVDHYKPAKVCKVPVGIVPLGDSISRDGETLWGAYNDAGTLISVAATADEVRRKYRERKRAQRNA